MAAGTWKCAQLPRYLQTQGRRAPAGCQGARWQHHHGAETPHPPHHLRHHRPASVPVRRGQSQAGRGNHTYVGLLLTPNISIAQLFSLLVVLISLHIHSLVSPYKGPRNLQTSEPSKTSFRVTWDHAPGDVRGYKVTFHPVGEDIYMGELKVGPYDNTVVLEELRCVFRPHCLSQSLCYCISYYINLKTFFFCSTELEPNTQ